MTNDQVPMTNKIPMIQCPKLGFGELDIHLSFGFGHWKLNIGICLVIVTWVLEFLKNNITYYNKLC